MTEKNAQDIVNETTEVVETKFTRIKNRLKNINPAYYAVAATAAVTVAGMIVVGRTEKTVINIETEKVVVEPEPTPEV